METPARRAVALARWLLVAAALGSALVLHVRIASWSNCWRLSITEGREAPAVYALWRVLHGAPLYEWPTRPPYSITLYNFGFYRVYAALLGMFGVTGEGLLAVPRFFSLAGALFGAGLTVEFGARLARPRGALGWASLVALAFTLWFGTQFTSWWALGVRPDMWAGALALLGLRLALFALLEQRYRSVIVASLVFFAAWSFKQSSVWMFAGCVAGAALVGEIRGALALALPCFVLSAVSLLVGGAAYRYNVLHAPTTSAWHATLLAEVAGRAYPQNLFVFGVAGWYLFCRGRPAKEVWSELGRPERILAVVMFVAVTCGTLSLGREGSNKNHLLEGYVASGLAAWWALDAVSSLRQARGGSLVLLLASTAPLVLLPAVQLRGTNGAGRIVLCSPADARELETLASSVRALPKPLYSDDEIFSLPWNSSDGRYPALVLDGTWYGIARRERLIEAGFPFDLLASGRFRSALFQDGHPDLEVLARSGADCSPLDGAPFGLHYTACTLSGR